MPLRTMIRRRPGTPLLSTAVALLVSGCASAPRAAAGGETHLTRLAPEVLAFAADQYRRAATQLDPVRDGYPRATTDSAAWKTVRISDWTSGFFPGTLWYLHEYTGDPALRSAADRWTWPLAEITRGRYDHDLGFQYMSAFGNAQRITGDARYRAPLLDAATHLARRFDPEVGSIRSWDFGRWKFPVIIDNMMNLELLTTTARHGGAADWHRIAIAHARTTRKNHVRPDYGTFHVVGYDPDDGSVTERMTHQGFSDPSTWARGQSWAVYGFTMMYRETGDPEFLEAARRLATYAIGRLPEDHVPCWDYDAPGCPATAKRDASAGAVLASALLELSQYAPASERARYADTAEAILTSLSTSYLAKGTGKPSILLHSVGHHSANSEVDVGINYADYYFVEGLVRYLELQGVRPRAVLPRGPRS